MYARNEADAVMDAYEVRIKHLEAILDDLDPRRNLSLVYENQQLRDRIKELEAEDARMKKQVEELCKQVPVFHVVADGDLPSDKRDVIAITKFSRYIDNYLGFYHDEHHWRIHDKVIMWCELPTEPST